MSSKAMITIFVENCNLFSQDFYDSVINSLQFHKLKCSCGHSGCLTIHAYYYRYVKQPDSIIKLRICRVKCSECGATHALLLSSIVPYSQISLSDQHHICIDYDNGHPSSDICSINPSIDENNVKSVLRNYRRHWKEMLRSLRIKLGSVTNLVLSCFSNYSVQFMQIHRRVNLFFSNNHIALPDKVPLTS